MKYCDVSSKFGCLRNVLCFIFLLLFRLRASESVQYFQFDTNGDMYVYGPGSGFSGPCLKVEAGFEMGEASGESLFNSGDSNFSSNLSEGLVMESQCSVKSDEHDNGIIEPTPNVR